MTDDPTAAAAKDLAPTGRMRVAINYGNDVLVQGDPEKGEPRGVSPALARELAKRLGVPMDVVPFRQAGAVFEALGSGVWDVCFLAIDPVRSAGIAFSPPYVLIESTYLVREDSPIRSVEDADKPGTRIAVTQGSAYDLFLTRALKNAELIRFKRGIEAFRGFLDDGLEALAGIRQPIEAYAASTKGLRVIPKGFASVAQAMGTHAGREAGARYLHGFIEEMKRTGFVSKALAESGQGDATVAPPA